MKALENRQDIELLVNTFYTKVRKDKVIGFFFNDIAKTNWEEHLPKMYRFWETLLFGKASYKGNPMMAHIPVNAQVPMERHHFAHWFEIWSETVQELFEGETAELAIYKARNISQLMGMKMETATRLSRGE